MAHGLLRLQDLVYDEPPRFCKLWESQGLAAVSRALSARAGTAAAAQVQKASHKTHAAESKRKLIEDSEHHAAHQDTAICKRTRSVSAYQQDPGGHTPVASAYAAQLDAHMHVDRSQPLPAPQQKDNVQQGILSLCTQDELPARIAVVQLPQPKQWSQHHAKADSMSAASFMHTISSIAEQHSGLLHTMASAGGMTRQRQGKEEQQSAGASVANPAEFMCNMVEAFAGQMAALTPAPSRQHSQHGSNELLLCYLEAAAACQHQQHQMC